MTNTPAAPKVRFPPPLVYIGLLLLGPLVTRIVAVPPLVTPWPVGAVVTALGLGIIAIAIGLFRKAGEDPQPWTPSREIIATGLYRYTRNPMYLGMAIAQIGLALLMHNWVSLVLVALAVAII